MFFLKHIFFWMRRVADTVPEELCVYPALWSRLWNVFFGSGSAVRTADIVSLQVHHKDNALEIQAPTYVCHNFKAKY